MENLKVIHLDPMGPELIHQATYQHKPDDILYIRMDIVGKILKNSTTPKNAAIDIAMEILR